MAKVNERHYTAVIEVLQVDTELEERTEYDRDIREQVTRRHKTGDKGKTQVAHVVVRANTLPELKTKILGHVGLI